MKRFAITPLAALGILAAPCPVARAADTTCTTTISSGTIKGNLLVPAGATCFLKNVTVTGNAQVEKGANLNVVPLTGQTVKIGGNLQAAHCQGVVLEPEPGGSGAIFVGGNVQIRNCTGQIINDATLLGTLTIGGNFACDHNSEACIVQSGSVGGNIQVNNNSAVNRFGAIVAFNVVGGNVQVNNNSAGAGNNRVQGNTVGGNLQCAGNTPGVSGGGNTVTGTKQGQCAGL